MMETTGVPPYSLKATSTLRWERTGSTIRPLPSGAVVKFSPIFATTPSAQSMNALTEEEQRQLDEFQAR